jgi:phosphatidylglycerol:prolipoprotein diacylglycerol transferase
MRQVLFEIPVVWLLAAVAAAGVAAIVYGLVFRRKETALTGCVIAAGVTIAAIVFWQKVSDGRVPIFGFGMMLCLAFFAGSWLLQRLARREGLDVDRLMDLALWLFIGGIIGARLLFLVLNRKQFSGPLDFFKFWQGGIVFYGGVVAAVPVFMFYTRRFKLPAMRVLDVIAPAVALGIGIGRFGCLMNGCCWGKPTDVPWAITFPYGSIPHFDQLIKYPKRVTLGFHTSNHEGAEPVIHEVDSDSWADAAGLRSGDVVRRVNVQEVARLERGHEMRDAPALLGRLRDVEPGSELSLDVARDERPVSVAGTFTPRPPHSLPVHPTQIYLALAGLGLLAATIAYFPRRTRYGEVMVVLMIGYSLTRFAIEFFRDDEPPAMIIHTTLKVLRQWFLRLGIDFFGNTAPTWVDRLTISQNISIVIFAGGLLLWAWLRRGPAIADAAK